MITLSLSKKMFIKDYRLYKKGEKRKNKETYPKSQKSQRERRESYTKKVIFIHPPYTKTCTS
jgi:hypothetical protein